MTLFLHFASALFTQEDLTQKPCGVLVYLTLVQAKDDPSRQAQELVERLRSAKIEEREEATRKLKNLGKAALSELEKVRGDKDPEVASRAHYLLEVVALRDKLSPKLRKIMPGLEDRLAVGGHVWTEVLLEVIRRDSQGFGKYPDLRNEDVIVLTGPGVREARTVKEKLDICTFLTMDPRAKDSGSEIAGLLKDGNADVRARVAWALGKLNAKETAPEILKLLEDGNAAVRSHAIEALGSLGGRETIPGIVNLLKDEDSVVRSRASEALGRLGAKESVPKLVNLLKDGAPQVRQSSTVALQRLSARETAPEIALLLTDEAAFVRHTAAFALATLGAKESAAGIVKLLDGGAGDRLSALQALETLRAKETTPEILRLLKDGESGNVRSMAATVLASFGAKESASEIVNLLRDENSNVRLSAVGALQTLGAKETAPAIARLLTDEAASVRFRAASSLCSFGLKEGVGVLLEDARKVPKEFPVSLCALNALRQREVWECLTKVPQGRDFEGTIHQAFERLGRETGLRIVFPTEGNTDSSITEWTKWRGDQASMLEGLENNLTSCDHEMILERDCIRIVPREEALAFWLAWWHEVEKN